MGLKYFENDSKSSDLGQSSKCTKDIKRISNDSLILNIKRCVLEERKCTLEVIEYLQEIECRKLHLRLGFSSLHSFCVSELHYTDAAAARRIEAMRLTREIPEVKESLKEGTLNLSNLALTQYFFKAEKKKGEAYSRQEKVTLLQEIKNKSTRETIKILKTRNPEIGKEKMRILNGEEIQISFVANKNLQEKLDRAKALVRSEDSSYAKLFELALDHLLEKLCPLEKIKRREKRIARMSLSEKGGGNLKAKNLGAPAKLKKNFGGEVRSRHIPSQIRHQVFIRAEGKCEFIGNSGRCGSSHYLEVHHIHAFGKGGETCLENLKLLCHNHNILKAYDDFGADVMKRYCG